MSWIPDTPEEASEKLTLPSDPEERRRYLAAKQVVDAWEQKVQERVMAAMKAANEEGRGRRREERQHERLREKQEQEAFRKLVRRAAESIR